MTPAPGRVALANPDLEDPRWPRAELRADGSETTLFLNTSDLAALSNLANQAWPSLGPPFFADLGKLVPSHQGCSASGFQVRFLRSYPHPPVARGRCLWPQQLREGAATHPPRHSLAGRSACAACLAYFAVSRSPGEPKQPGTSGPSARLGAWFGARLFPTASATCRGGNGSPAAAPAAPSLLQGR